MGKRGGLNRYLTLVLFLLNSVFLLSAPIIEISKSNSSGIIQPNTYDNGEQILYKIKVSNSAGTDLNNIKISVPLSSITSSVETGGTGVVFTNLINQIKGSGGGAATGSISLTGDFLATGVDIPVGGYVEYFVLGTVNPLINGPIVTTGTVTDTSGNTELATISNTLTRIPYTYTIVKSSPISYYEKDGVVSYKIKVTNTGSATIKNFSLVDNLPNELIGSTITATASAGGNVGSFLQSGNLNATGILIPSGGNVEYTINASVKPGVTGTIENIAQSTVRSQSEESNTVALTLANYDFTINKTTTSANYTPNQNLTYKVKITNNSSTVKITKMKLEDILSTITATSADGSTKQAFVSGTISTTATVSDSGNSSGTFNATGDLSVTDITILPNTYIEYTIVGKVRDDIVGPITNPVKVTDRNGVEKNTILTINSVAPNLNLTKTANVSTYKPGDTIIYTVTLENTGAGIASNYYVEDLLNGIVGNLANTGGPAATNSASSQLFNNWSILATFASGSTKSTSVIVNNGGSIANQNLQDIVTIFPGEKITYTITGITKNAAIGAIINKVDLKQGVTLITSKTATSNPASLANNASVVITKVPTETEYKPGDIITYTITVNNPTTSYMDNVQIKDLLSQITATQIDGTPGAAFESWDLSVLSSSGIGTVSGTEALLNQSGNLILTADIGANGTIVYQLKAKVKSTTVGTILDTVTGSGDNVPESGSGVKMS
ncbi:MAG: beta strand repeat-containing protein, partial [Cetobacterium sp.]